MGAFTMELGEVLESFRDPGNGATIGLDSYPLFDNAYRDGLNRKIIDHYILREIGVETPQMFRFAMRRKMNEIMPYWNQMYKSTVIEFDPLSTFDLATIRDATDDSVADTTTENLQDTNTTTKTRTIGSDLPQTLLDEDENYGSTGSNAKAENTGGLKGSNKGNTKSNTKSSDKSTTKGRQGNPSALIAQYRLTLLNVDMMVIGELEPLFMQVWDVPDRYRPNTNWGITE
jgi:hypothetical protein